MQTHQLRSGRKVRSRRQRSSHACNRKLEALREGREKASRSDRAGKVATRVRARANARREKAHQYGWQHRVGSFLACPMLVLTGRAYRDPDRNARAAFHSSRARRRSPEVLAPARRGGTITSYAQSLPPLTRSETHSPPAPLAIPRSPHAHCRRSRCFILQWERSVAPSAYRAPRGLQSSSITQRWHLAVALIIRGQIGCGNFAAEEFECYLIGRQAGHAEVASTWRAQGSLLCACNGPGFVPSHTVEFY